MFAALKVFIFLILLVASIVYGGMVSFDFVGVDVHLAVIVTVFGVVCYLYGKIKAGFRFFASFFAAKSNYEKGIDNLQLAFSGMLLKDKKSAAEFIKKSRRYLGDMPLISWLEGQLCLVNNDKHRAKAIFYSLCEREKNTALGAYSLCQMAIKNKSDDDALNAINAILKVNPDAQDLLEQAIAIAVKNKKFAEAEKFLSSLKNTKKDKLIEAVVLSEKGTVFKDIDSVKKAFRLAPQLSEIAISYADMLVRDGEYGDARSVLAKNFERSPNQHVFNKYISCGKDLSNLDKMKLAEKLEHVSPESWIGYYGLAKLAVEDGMFLSAFQNLLVAYSKAQYDFIADDLLLAADRLDNPKPLSAVEVLSKPLESKHMNFMWKCSECGAEENRWNAVCPYCNSIASYDFIEHEATDKGRLSFQ